MHFIVNIQREKESRMTSRSRSEDISLGRHALTSKPWLTPRLGLCQSMSPSTDIFRSGTWGHSWFSYSENIKYYYGNNKYIYMYIVSLKTSLCNTIVFIFAISFNPNKSCCSEDCWGWIPRLISNFLNSSTRSWILHPKPWKEEKKNWRKCGL